jgi:dihydrodipicolinate synthase/N-acetylneuraminate lyase
VNRRSNRSSWKWRSSLPVLLYDVPVYTGTQLAVDSITRLLGHQNVVGLKDSTADAQRLQELLGAIGGIRGAWFLQGKEHLLAESVLSGGSGVITTFSHFAPRAYVALCEAARRGEGDRALAIQRHVTALYHLVTECLARRPAISTLYHMVNHALRRRGICQNILLTHEGPCPDWLKGKANEALELASAAEEAV